MDDGLAQAGDPLLLAEGVVGLQAVWVSFRAPSAAHAETVPHWQMGRKSGEGREGRKKGYGVGFTSTTEVVSGGFQFKLKYIIQQT